MKNLLFVLTLAVSSFAHSETFNPFGTDFAPFPLSTGNVALIEGIWRGESIDIEIKDSGYAMDDKPILWVKIQDHESGDTRRGIMYYNESSERYQLSTLSSLSGIPISLGIFEFSSNYAAKAGLKCPLGGALLKIEFMVDTIMGEVFLTKESCS